MELSRSAVGFNRSAFVETIKGLHHGGLGVPLLLLVMLAMMTLPVPTILLDLLFTFNIAMALVVLLVCVYAQRPLDFALFPTILLAATLLRLALNVASTRVVLLFGHNGGDAAGAVIETALEVHQARESCHRGTGQQPDNQKYTQGTDSLHLHSLPCGG